MFAWCDANGTIAITIHVPKGALAFARGPEKKLRDIITATARLAYDSKTWLVPGIPEATSSKEKLEALEKYTAWINPRLKEKGCRSYREVV